MHDEKTWQLFVQNLFESFGIPEIEEEDLAPGTYTNAQIADHFRDKPLNLIWLLKDLPKDISPEEKRSLLSLYMEMMKNNLL